MRSINSSKKSSLENIQVLNKITDKAFGVLRFDPPILFKTRWGIHTWFLKQPIDVLILDKNYKVVKVYENLKPFRVAFWNPRYDIVVELQQGTIHKSKSKVGDQLEIKKDKKK